MKKIGLALLLFTMNFSAKSQQENVIRIDSKINDVTVYLAGAEVRHNANIHLKIGMNRIIFTGLSRYLESTSVQVSVEGKLEILSVSTESNFLNSEKPDQRIVQLNDTIALMESAVISINDQMDAYKTEKSVLTVNQSIGSNQSGVSMVELQKAIDFYREKTLQINKQISELSKSLGQLNKKLTSAKNQLADLNYQNNPERKEVMVVIVSSSDQNTTALLRYLVSNTGWEATYDLIAEDIKNPVELKYKAKVYNNTGIDWKQVRLKFSTADPSLGATKPALTTWILNYSSGANEGRVDFKPAGVNVLPVEPDTSVNYSEISAGELSTEFEIEKPYDIPSDGKPYLVDIAHYTLDAMYQYFTIPKVDQDAFLLARVTGWEKLNLIDGPANVYFGNTYIGESMIDTRSIEDTLDLSMGRNNRVLVTRKKKEDYGSKKLVGTRREESFTYEISVKNNSGLPIDIEVQDQVPVSQESDIVVDIIQTSGATPDALSGKLIWNSHINAGESVTYVISFSVKYPRNRQVQIRKSRRVFCPQF
ncbi:MAG TPA: DUF4139 domain-containing protein [Chitinophagales bacterium]|nr:DUF4139 domain-containing protein [Chitinophagales bacterium]